MNQTEIYTVSSSTSATTGSLSNRRSNFTLNVVAASGGAEKVLAAGGNGGGCFGGVYNSTELYSVSGGTWSAGANLNTGRLYHASVSLNDGTVLVIGGMSTTNASSALNLAEIYDPVANTWSTTSGNMKIERGSYHAAVVLDDGKVLVTGGKTASNSGTATAEIYDPSTGQWTLMQSMGTARFDHTATLLPDGNVLVAGGVSTSSKADLYDYLGNSWSNTTDLNTGRSRHTSTLLNNGSVFVAGGIASGGTSNKTEIFNSQ